MSKTPPPAPPAIAPIGNLLPFVVDSLEPGLEVPLPASFEGGIIATIL